MNIQHLPNLPAFQAQDVNQDPATKTYQTLIRLHKDVPAENGYPEMKNRFFCSGFVISDKYALTAAHCIHDDHYFLEKGDILVHDMHLNSTTIAKAAAMNVTSDLG